MLQDLFTKKFKDTLYMKPWEELSEVDDSDVMTQACHYFLVQTFNEYASMIELRKQEHYKHRLIKKKTKGLLQDLDQITS